MSLQQKLNERKAQFESTASPELVEVMHRATQDLRASGLAEKALNVGDTIPEFILPNSEGVNVKIGDVISRGPLVLTFYRGVW